MADFFVLNQLRENAHEGHGGGDFTVARAVEDSLEGFQRRGRNADALGAALWQVTAKGGAAFVQVFVLGAALFGFEEGQVFQLIVHDRNVKAVAEFFQAVDIDFFGVVRGVLRFAGTGAIAFNGLG